MSSAFYQQIQQQIEEVKAEGLYKSERVITSQQQAAVKISTGEEVLNFCANNYLGLANHPALIEAGKAGMDEHGFGMASVRFICGAWAAMPPPGAGSARGTSPRPRRWRRSACR